MTRTKAVESAATQELAAEPESAATSEPAQHPARTGQVSAGAPGSGGVSGSIGAGTGGAGVGTGGMTGVGGSGVGGVSGVAGVSAGGGAPGSGGAGTGGTTGSGGSSSLGQWHAAELVETDDAGDASIPQVAVDSSGNAIAVWFQSDGIRRNVWANRYVPGVGWVPPP